MTRRQRRDREHLDRCWPGLPKPNRSKRARGRMRVRILAKIKEKNEYAGVRLVDTAPIAAIPDDWKEQFYLDKEDEEAAA